MLLKYRFNDAFPFLHFSPIVFFRHHHTKKTHLTKKNSLTQSSILHTFTGTSVHLFLDLISSCVDCWLPPTKKTSNKSISTNDEKQMKIESIFLSLFCHRFMLSSGKLNHQVISKSPHQSYRCSRTKTKFHTTNFHHEFPLSASNNVQLNHLNGSQIPWTFGFYIFVSNSDQCDFCWHSTIQ